MRKLLLLLLVAPLFSQAQKKPYLEIGGVGGYYFKSEAFAYGASLGFNGQMNDFLTVGVGFMPLWQKDVKKPQLPVYGDLRIRIDQRASLLLQPGYNFYKTSSSASAGNVSVKSEVKGGFYGGAGLAFDFPVRPNTAIYVHAKYNYFGYQSNATMSANGNTTTSSAKSHTDAVTLGVGVRLQ